MCLGDDRTSVEWWKACMEVVVTVAAASSEHSRNEMHNAHGTLKKGL